MPEISFSVNSFPPTQSPSLQIFDQTSTGLQEMKNFLEVNLLGVCQYAVTFPNEDLPRSLTRLELIDWIDQELAKRQEFDAASHQ